MNLHGTLATNLKDAITSMRRLRGHAAHLETATYWADPLDVARLTRNEVAEAER